MPDPAPSPTPPPARAAADAWLADLDRVLAPDDGADPIGRGELLRQSNAAAANAPMRWTADQAERGVWPPPGARVAGARPSWTLFDETHLWQPLALPRLARYYVDRAGVVRANDVPPDVEPVDLVASVPMRGDGAVLSAAEAAEWIEQHAFPLDLTAHQRDVLADTVAARAELVGWRRHGAVRLGVDLSAGGATVVVVHETDGGAVEVLDTLQVPVDGDALARHIAATEGLDGWAAREEAGRRILDRLLGTLGAVFARVVVTIRASVDRFVAAMRPLADAFRRVGAAMARLFRRTTRPPQRRVELARRRRVDRALRTVARRRARRERRARHARR